MRIGVFIAALAQAYGAVTPRAPHGLRVDYTELDAADSTLALGVSLSPTRSNTLR